MNIRTAEAQDIPAIVALLKASLGEGLMPKSEDFWRWKHIDNPFGTSPVLLAEDKGNIVGVRAFMPWEWQVGHESIKAVRAVDTATHPDYQGKGIFKKLTLRLVDQCIQQHIALVFNTPNQKSMHGYLKMGWQVHGKLPIQIRPLFNWKKVSPDFLSAYPIPENFQPLSGNRQGMNMQTPLRSDYFRWRYALNPNIRYGLLEEPGQYQVFFRLKPNRLGIEFRITDLMLRQGADPLLVKDAILKVAKAGGANVITLAGEHFPFMMPRVKMGPMITVRVLAPHNKLDFNYWTPSMGDMELF